MRSGTGPYGGAGNKGRSAGVGLIGPNQPKYGRDSSTLGRVDAAIALAELAGPSPLPSSRVMAIGVDDCREYKEVRWLLAAAVPG